MLTCQRLGPAIDPRRGPRPVTLRDVCKLLHHCFIYGYPGGTYRFFVLQQGVQWIFSELPNKEDPFAAGEKMSSLGHANYPPHTTQTCALCRLFCVLFLRLCFPCVASTVTGGEE